MDHVFIDIETYSECPITHGVWAYAAHPSTEILMIGIAWNDGPVIQWLPDGPYPMPQEYIDLNERVTKDPQSIQVHAYNAQFERANFRYHFRFFDFPIEVWRCDMVLAYSLALPGSLEQVGQVLKMHAGDRKLDTGSKLIKTFCMPLKPTKIRPWSRANSENEPELWEEFREYHIRDVVAERKVWRFLRKWDMPEQEWSYWHLDQHINQRGMPIDQQLLDYAIPFLEKVREALLYDIAKITGLEKPNSRNQVLGWLQERIELPNLQKQTLIDALQLPMPERVEQMIRLRQQTSRTSTSKYQALVRGMNGDGRLRGAFQFDGAGRTGRFGGRLFQPQNLPRPVLNTAELETATDMIRSGEGKLIASLFSHSPMEVLSSCVRSCVRAGPGKELIVADLSSIENVVLGWVTGCRGINEIHEKGRDPYKSFGVHFFDKLYEKITKAERNICKPPVLGAGFGIGGGHLRKDKKSDLMVRTGLWGYAFGMGIDIDEETAQECITTWRKLYPEVVQFWYELERGFRAAMKYDKDKAVKMKEVVGALEITSRSPFIRIKLPSGRHLSYLRPRLKWLVPPWEEENEKPKPKLTITYEGRADSGGWGRISTRGAKLIENVVQAIARDVLCAGMAEATATGHKIVLHVHDEIVTEADKGSDANLLTLLLAMTKQIPWAPEMTLRAEGYRAPFYRKD